MNLLIRMIWVWILSLRRERLPVGVAESRLQLITLLNDLDINLHMNNGRYLTIADLSRLDLFIRTGLVKLMRKERWVPLVTEHTMIYKRSLRLFQRFEVAMQLTHWDDQSFYMSHQFLVKNRVIAEGTSKGVILGRQGIVQPETVLSRLKDLRGAT